MNIKVKRTQTWASAPAQVPQYQTPGAAGFDFRASLDRSVTIPPGGRHPIPTGLAFEIPHGFELQVRPRSGLAFKHGVLTTFGTIDSDYRGEVQINLINHGRIDFTVQPGDRIAQGVIAPVVRAEFELVDELTKTDRGTQGFGSTGVK